MGQKTNIKMGKKKRTMGEEKNNQMGQKMGPKTSSSTIDLQLQTLWKFLFAVLLPKISWSSTIHVSLLIL